MKGFTLVETLVAISLISIAITAPLYSASQSITLAHNARYQLIASFLAQEGIEYVHMLRDNAYLTAYRSGSASASSDAWNTFLNGNALVSVVDCVSPNVCSLDPVQGVSPHLAACLAGVCGPLYLLPNGVYTQSGGVNGALQQPFVRTIQVQALSATDEKITSTVTWSFHNAVYAVSIIDHLMPWQ